MSKPQIYDSIGVGYKKLRRADKRILAAIEQALESAQTVLNVGAGTGSYEPQGRTTVALEPSATMIRQRPVRTAQAVRALAGAIPFRDGSFDTALAVLTIHHWPDRARCLAELRRVARSNVVLLTWDPDSPGFWLTEYFPEILSIDKQLFPSMDELRAELGTLSITNLPIPRDCTDGFLGAYWQRPEAYLLPAVRAAISTFSKLANVKDGLSRLQNDLESGAWLQRNAHLLERESLDLGYRLVVADTTCAL